MMTDNQRIHPVDAEAATAPLAPHGSFRSDKGDPATAEYPPLRRTLPVSHIRPPKKRRNCCCRCFCWTLLSLITLVLLVAAAAGILYLVFRPKLPKYSVDSLQISNFAVNPDMSVAARFDVTITAKNPNKNIGIYYERGSNLSVWYTDTMLCSGTLPTFYQGHRNTTVLNVALSGQTQVGSSLLQALQEQQQTGSIPLDFKGDVPVRVKFGKLKVRKVTFRVRCKLVVNSLSANNPIKITTSSCKFKFKL